MEDPRLSRMYAKLFTRSLAKRRLQTLQWTQTNRTSLLVFALILGMILFGLGYIAHLHGRFNRLKTELKAIGTNPVEMPPMPGGQEPIVMQRSLLTEGSAPEFLSATLLPGRGLNVFQLMIYVPGRGAIPLLAAPSLEEAVTRMTGTGNDGEGQQSLVLGAPIEAPFSGAITGSLGADGRQVMTEWHGRTFALPITSDRGSVPRSVGGLLLKTESDAVKQNVMPDGGTVQGRFAASAFGGRWPSETSVAVTALMSSRAFELKMIARNEGKEPTPIGLGWHPQILLPSGSRVGVKLRLPAEAREEVMNGRVTGRTMPVAGTTFDFTNRAGRLLKEADLDDTFVDLRSGFLDNGPTLELRDPKSGVGVRMTAMSTQIHAIHVRSRPNESRVALGFQTNYDDPFNKAWEKDGVTGIHLLQPGQSLQWRIRLELFPVTDQEKPLL